MTDEEAGRMADKIVDHWCDSLEVSTDEVIYIGERKDLSEQITAALLRADREATERAALILDSVITSCQVEGWQPQVGDFIRTVEAIRRAAVGG